MTGSAEVAALDVVAQVDESVVAGGPAHGCRAIDVRVAGGIDLRILPDRGLDLGSAWYRGVPFAWRSAVGERAPFDAPSGADWLDGFGGGLVTTCGLRNVGAASEGHGLHGRYSHLRASSVAWERAVEGDEVVVAVSGVVDEVSALGPHLRLTRRITTRTGRGAVVLEDRVENLGATAEPAPILYHVNLGAPLLGPAARVEIAGSRPEPRDDPASVAGWERWAAPGGPVAGADEIVLEHVWDDAGAAGAAARSGAAQRSARVVNPDAGIAVTVSWDRAGLPRLWQWIHPRAGVYALGLEPANCSVLGRAADRAAGRLPVLEPGEARVTRLCIQAAPC